MSRVVLLSDPSKEFTGNTSARFKVRLPTQLSLTAGNWEMELVSLSLPDAEVPALSTPSGAHPHFLVVAVVRSLQSF